VYLYAAQIRRKPGAKTTQEALAKAGLLGLIDL
jgi:hypothetical protein